MTDGEIRRESYSNRFATALHGIDFERPGTTLCFGYPAFVADHPPAYSFLSELAASPVDQIPIETAQSNLDLGVLDVYAR